MIHFGCMVNRDDNVFKTPALIRAIRAKKEICVRDRSTYDNLVEVARKLALPLWILRLILRITDRIYSHTDLKVLTTASIDELLVRRQDEAKDKQEQNLALYETLKKGAVPRSSIQR